jgi:hypothetical protein
LSTANFGINGGGGAGGAGGAGQVVPEPSTLTGALALCLTIATCWRRQRHTPR